MINFKKWLEDVAVAGQDVSNPNNPSNIAAKTIANKAFVNQTDKGIQLATARSPKQIATTALGMAATAFKNPTNQKMVGSVTPAQIAQTITKGITNKPMPTNLVAMGKK